MKYNKSFLGVGWKFPPEFDKREKSVVLVSEEQDIRESLFILLSTRPGERVMQPKYGCNLSLLNFESISDALVNRAKEIIHKAVLNFEARIQLEDVIVVERDDLEGKLVFQLVYTIRKTNKRSNIVYPYYILEGTEIVDMPK